MKRVLLVTQIIRVSGPPKGVTAKAVETQEVFRSCMRVEAFHPPAFSFKLVCFSRSSYVKTTTIARVFEHVAA